MNENDDVIGGETLDFKERLRALFWEHLPKYRSDRYKGECNLARIARGLEISSQAVQAWLTNGKVSFRQAKKLTELDGSTLTLELLWPFCDPD